MPILTATEREKVVSAVIDVTRKGAAVVVCEACVASRNHLHVCEVVQHDERGYLHAHVAG